MTTLFRGDIESMAAYEPGEQPQPGKFIKLNTNENPYPCSSKVTLAIERAVRKGMYRYPDPWATAFCNRAAQVLGVDPDWILCGNGSDDILTVVTRAFVGAGQWLRFPTPSYVLYQTLADIQGAQAEAISFQPDWSLGDDFVQPRDDLTLAYLANPNSPSGTVLDAKTVLNMAQRLPCPLLVDEAYVDFAETNCLSLVAQHEKILVVRSLSKSYALAGLRFGFLVAQPHIIQTLRKVKDSYNCGVLAIAGATAAIDDQVWLAENRGRIVVTRTRLTEGLRSLGFVPVDSQANFVWSPHPEVPVRSIYERLKAKGILVRYMQYSGSDDGLRISVGSDAQIDALMTTLPALI